MIKINKDLHQVDFDVYSSQLLTDIKTKRGKHPFFPALSDGTAVYDKFSKNKYRKNSIPPSSRYAGWLDILKNEQQYRCCYCMRSIADGNLSVEHIIPKSAPTKDYTFYVGYAPRLGTHVQMGEDFELDYSQNPVARFSSITRFPHPIAHSNLFISCNNDSNSNGIGCSCNNSRGHKRIIPMMLMDNIENYVHYTPDGKIQILLNPTDVFDTLMNLDIQTTTLETIRNMWYLVSRQDVMPNTVNLDDASARANYLILITGSPDFCSLPNKYSAFIDPQDTTYWNLFLQYGWFYQYYSKHYPLIDG